jgi:hypothetical protein
MSSTYAERAENQDVCGRFIYNLQRSHGGLRYLGYPLPPIYLPSGKKRD